MWTPTPPPAPITATRSPGRDLSEVPDVNRGRDGIGDHRGLDGIEALRKRDGVALRNEGDLGVAAVACSSDRAGRVLAQRLVPAGTKGALAAEEVEVRGDARPEPALVRLRFPTAVTRPTSSWPGTIGRSSGRVVYCPLE